MNLSTSMFLILGASLWTSPAGASNAYTKGDVDWEGNRGWEYANHLLYDSVRLA